MLVLQSGGRLGGVLSARKRTSAVPVRSERSRRLRALSVHFFFQAEDGIRDVAVTGVQTCALPILHPLFRQYLEGGEMVEWGAKTIPEGGYYAAPARRSGDGVVILGDSAGFVDVPSLKIGRASCRERV